MKVSISSKKVLGAMDCGCLIIELEQIANFSPKYYRIEYCAKHKANYRKNSAIRR
jgi:hypothetical protein